MQIFSQPPSASASWLSRLLGSCLMIILAICTGVDVHAAANDNVFSYQGIFYTKNIDGVSVSTRMYLERSDEALGSAYGGQIKISGNPSAEGDIVIPSTVYDPSGKSYTVTTIGSGSFATTTSLPEYAGSRITSVTLPETVTLIASQAFEGQSKLTSIKIGSGVTTIAARAFRSTGLPEISDLGNVEIIGNQAFYGCASLRSVCLPPTVKEIRDEAFAVISCGIGSFILQSSPKMGKDVFRSTTVRRRVIPEGNTTFVPPLGNVTTIDPIITYPDDAVISNGWIYNADKTNLYLAPPDLVDCSDLPSNLRYIGPNAFAWSEKLNSVKFPANLDEIGEGAFAYCKQLGSVVFNDKLTHISDYAFYVCSEINDMEFPESLFAIGKSAFSGCKKLESVILPKSMQEIGDAAFSFTGLKLVRLYGDVNLGTQLFSNCASLNDVELPGNLKELPAHTFQKCTALESIGLPVSLNSIGSNAFDGCTALQNIYFGPNISLVGSKAFNDCTNLKQVVLAGNLTTLRDEVFSGCTNLRAVVLGPNLTEKGYNIFKDCPSLVKVAVPQGMGFGYNSPFASITYPKDGVVENACVYNSDKSTLYFLSIFTQGRFEIPNSLVTIQSNAAMGCDAITEIVINPREEPLYLGSDCFKDCSAIAKVTASTLEDWMRCSFGSETANPMSICGSLYINDQEVSELSMGDDWGDVGQFQFVNGKNIKSLTLPQNCSYIGQSAFKGCSSIESIVIPAAVFQLTVNCFEDCTSLTDVTFGEGVQYISSNAFGKCSKLKKITALMPLPNTAIDAFDSQMSQRTLTAPTDYVLDYAITDPWSLMGSFACPDGKVGLTDVSGLRYVYNTANNTAAVRKFDYSSLTDVEIPARINQSGVFCHVIKMADGVFENNTSLRTLSIGRNLESIPDNAFNGCTSLQSVTFNENSILNRVGKLAFNDCSAMKECMLPQAVGEIGEKAFKNCSSLERVFTGNAVTWIQSETFMDCTAMKDLTIGGAVTGIGKDAFRGCASLTSLMLPPTLQTIGVSAFACENGKLKEVKMGFSLNWIADKVFEGQTELSDIYITRDTPPSAYATTFSNYKATLHVVPGTVEVYSEAAPCWFNFYDNGNVKEMVPVQEVKISETSLDSPKPGDTFQLSATVSPANATMTEVYWVSTNPRIATVTSDGLVTIQDTFDVPVALAAFNGDEWEDPDDSYCEIRAYSMFGNVPEAVCTIGTLTAVDEISDELSADRFDATLPYEVYTLQGVFVGHNIDNLSGGLYILRQGKNVRKVLLDR